MSTSVYRGEFSSWTDVQRDFDTDASEPDQVFLAEYETGSYEGSAVVLYRNADKFFLVNASHCSCYGLEGQWKPEEYDLETLKKAMERHSNYSDGDKALKKIVAAL